MTAAYTQKEGEDLIDRRRHAFCKLLCPPPAKAAPGRVHSQRCLPRAKDLMMSQVDVRSQTRVITRSQMA